jgi:Ribbon-helix-helix protein, copG family
MDDPRKFEELVQFRAPAKLSEAINAAARQRCQSKSEFVRQSIIIRLKADGVDPQHSAGAV